MEQRDQPGAVVSSEGLGLPERLRQGWPYRGADARLLCEEAAAEVERMAVRLQGLKFDALGKPRTRYVRVTLNRSHCVMHPSEGDCYIEDARNAGDPDWERYIVQDVWLSEREFDDLPEFDGF